MASHFLLELIGEREDDTAGGQKEDKRRHRLRQRAQRTAGGQLEDKNRTTGGQHPNTGFRAAARGQRLWPLKCLEHFHVVSWVH